MNDYQITKHFNSREFRCKHCRELIVDLDFVKRLEKARVYAKTPFIINSGYRCPIKNTQAGGKSKSAHLMGKGVDIVCTHSYQRWLIINAAIKKGFKRIGIGSNFVHLDTNTDALPFPRLWTYYPTPKV